MSNIHNFIIERRQCSYCKIKFRTLGAWKRHEADHKREQRRLQNDKKKNNY